MLGTLFRRDVAAGAAEYLNLLGLGSFYQMTETGLIIVAAILLSRFIDICRGRA